MLGINLRSSLAHFELKIDVFEALNPRNFGRTNLGFSTLGTKSFEDEKLEEEGEDLKRRTSSPH